MDGVPGEMEFGSVAMSRRRGRPCGRPAARRDRRRRRTRRRASREPGGSPERPANAARPPTGRRRRPGPGGARPGRCRWPGARPHRARSRPDAPFRSGRRGAGRRDLIKRPGPPGLQLLVEQLRRAADLGRGQAVETELAHHPLRLSGRHAFDVHFRHRQHHGADRPAAAFERVRIERRAVMAGGLWNVDGDRAHRRIDALGLVAVRIAPPVIRPLVEAGAEKPLALDLHRQLERPAEDRGDGPP